MALQLASKLALVSGSTAGIGFAIARALAAEGAVGRTADGVDNAVARIASTTGSNVFGFAGDLSVASTAAELVRQHPGVEILVNNMGIVPAGDRNVTRAAASGPDLRRKRGVALV